MRILRSRLAVFALWVVVCESATLLAAPLALCSASRAEGQATMASGVDADCPCGDETGTCPMHHKSATRRDRPAPSAPVRGKAYCSGCSDPSDAALLVMTGLAAPVITPFDLAAPQPEAAIFVISSTSFVPIVRPPSAPPPKA
ncbi:MAG: hypothetical protein HY048_19335 [Acidobacteria bacterium]|nr:hypothetical protein [Acidobacteriota bacterium]